ncbi:MAG: cytochrome c biogenesis protein ResB [bacterium]|nr:cytochrome c biogenesis protein ResB [bacterium]
MNKKKGLTDSLLSVLTSMKTAVILIGILIILSIAGSLIPQGKEMSFYTINYGESWGKFITSAHLDNFFSSWLFLSFSALFFINLASCSVLRLYRRIKRRAPLRPGPDIIHLSLLLIIILGVFVLFTRQETTVLLAPGESFTLPDSAEIRLVSFKIDYYEDGRPQDWTSMLELTTDDITEEYPVEVNKPLRYGAYWVFQNFYDLKPHAAISSRTGEYELDKQEGLTAETGAIYLMDINEIEGDTVGIFFLTEDPERSDYEELHLKKGDIFRGLTITDLYISEFSGLLVVYQPGTKLIIAALILFCAGLALTFYQKLGDELL